ncbi:radical SAM protein [bacterium]|nr:radical SAM protein [bacterium]MBU1064324.1 radical SAM protein [bacterium]MBU1635688.1 radical SAM protein [bacterium]MBU1874545.1 radical SAM protein [bacterium]
MRNAIKPLLVYSDGNGQVFNHDSLLALGASGEQLIDIPSETWILLPNGSQLMELPGRLPVGKNPDTEELITLESDENENIVAVAAFIAPAYTICYQAVYERLKDAPVLPLYAYSAVGWHEGQFYVPAIRIDDSMRQDPSQFNKERIEKAADQVMQRYPQNRLARHLVNNCAMTYGCPAALNYLLNRWEMPLPTSRVCNSDCLGCISLQEDTGVCSAQFRIEFTPTADEIIEIAVDHLETAPEPLVSFGQGCEGEPLMNAQLLIDTVKGIRQKTLKGTINLNTNASRPDLVAKLRDVGMDSMRVSLNSTRKTYYDRYFRPKGYTFDDVIHSIQEMKSRGGFVSLNLFVFPGFIDQPEEVESVEKLINDYQIDMIQWRNLNIDPEWYWEAMKPVEQEGIGIDRMIERIRIKFPNLRHGYFNPCLNQ